MRMRMRMRVRADARSSSGFGQSTIPMKYSPKPTCNLHNP